MDAFRNKRRALKGQITRIETIVTGPATQALTEAGLKLYLEKTDKLSVELDDLQQDIASTCLPADFPAEETEYNSLISRLEHLHIFFSTAVSQLHAARASAGSGAQTSGLGTDIRLPRLDLPTFSGNYVDWLSFHDLFVATVHDNIKLSNARKFQYLKSSLQDEAALLIKSIPITDGNYPDAWAILLNRYNNTREIIDAQLKRLFNQTRVAQESASELRKLIDTTSECIRALKVLQQPVEHWDSMLVYTVKEKLDPESRRQWELSLTGTTVPSFEELRGFLEQRARAIAAALATPNKVKPSTQTRKTTLTHLGTTGDKCIVCKADHSIYRCPSFIKAPVHERWDLVKKKSLCFNCLRNNHASADCKSGTCTKCTSKHNTLLHFYNNKTESDTSPKTIEPEIASHISRESSRTSQVLLSTAIVLVKDSSGQYQQARALLDSASEASFITEECAKRLQLKLTRFNVSIGGIGASGMGSSRSRVTLDLSSPREKEISLHVNALVLKKLTKEIPSMKVDPSAWVHIKGLQLADPLFHTPQEVDILLGADVYMDVLQEGHCKGPKSVPSAFNTIFGWAISGPLNVQNSSGELRVHHCSIDEQVRKFWELEELPVRNFLTPEEIQCEKHFAETHSRDDNGRYVVRLPFKDKPKPLGESRKIALRRFAHVERRLQSKPKVCEDYKNFMDEYLKLGHMKQIYTTEALDTSIPNYYPPHFDVHNERSSTTKTRVVFDASAKSSNGISLNDILLVGPKLQDDLVNILIRFRVHAIAMKADIAKMYRQIWVHHEDTDLQRIVWRRHPDEPIQDYRLLTVTYGTASAPYLATKVLQQLALEVKESFPLASEKLNNDFSMDDLLSGSNSIEKALTLQRELIEAAASAGFDLRKWVSNQPELLESIPPDKREIQVPLLYDNEATVTTLGLHWTPATDYFSYVVTSPPYRLTVTKRTILSDTAKIFDPLGLLSPVTIRAKVLLQDIWKSKQDWDDPLPESFIRRWQTFRSDLPEIEGIRISRHLSQKEVKQQSLQGFCDASEKAYAAAVFMKTTNCMGEVKVELIAAKTKVAPTKTVDVQRLELCSALLLVRLIKLIQESLSGTTELSDICCWSDSQNVLAWLRSPPHRWKTFVANRVAEIQEAQPTAQWLHVSGHSNPADCASRGISAVELKSHTTWWHGPEWLITSSSMEHTVNTGESEQCLVEEKKVKSYVTQFQYDSTLLSTYSSLRTLLRVTAMIFRFAFNAKPLNKTERRIGPLTKAALDDALEHWIKVVQQENYLKEITLLLQKRPIPAKSKILNLHPYVDTNGILRVGGRLRNANIPMTQIHPTILPRKSHLTDLLINHEHIKSLHGGSQLVIANLQKQYWIIGIRDAVRYQLKKCVLCTRHQAASAQQMMGDLPPARVNQARPFVKCGVDYAGPFLLRVIKGRGHKMFKAYLAVFVCFTTRAIHLELVSDMTTSAFLAALKRFVARRGKCSNIYSDCGTNFVGADREMREFMKLVKSTPHNYQVLGWLADEGITWHFNPPAAPHMGGLWEAGVKSVKYHLKRVVGNANLTYEEMQTLLCQIEACLNSRPLTALSTDPNDFTALTPGHFLIGDALMAIPEPDLTEEKVNRLSRWQLSQQLLQHFWKRWRNEYLARLQQRPKWAAAKANLAVGDLVLLKDEGQAPTKWKMARILQLHPGTDGLVRVVTVKTATDTELKRPVVKLCKLPLD